MIAEKQLKLALFTPRTERLSETFIAAHIHELPFDVSVFSGSRWAPRQDGKSALPVSQYMIRPLRRLGVGAAESLQARFLGRVLRNGDFDTVLAEFGPTGVEVVDACRRADVPLVVHFHGFDAFRDPVVTQYQDRYRTLMGKAAALVVVSQPMLERLLTWGADPKKLHLIPCGADSRRFSTVEPDYEGQRLLGVGRFVEKKDPLTTIRAFEQVSKLHPDAHMVMIGDGPLLGACSRLVDDLELGGRVTLMGAQSPQIIRDEMSRSTCFVQHSRVAPDGDSEGAPVTLMEAQLAGLPVVSTVHGGIPEIVRAGETGLLVAEGDTDGMADAISKLLADEALRRRMGLAARDYAAKELTRETSIEKLAGVIEASSSRASPAASS